MEFSRNIVMLKSGNSLFATIYIPFYGLQSAQIESRNRTDYFDQKSSNQSSFSLSGSRIQSKKISSLVDGSSWDVPAALLDSDSIHIIELNSAAERAGVQLGTSTSQGLARCPELLLYARSLSQEQRLEESLLQVAYRYSPYIENSGPGICTLDTRGRKDRKHQPWLQELLAQLHLLGLRAQAGVGSNPEISLQAAMIANPILEIDHLLRQSLALESLTSSQYLLDILKSWGIHTLGALARLPREEIGERLGLEGLSLWDRAAGRSNNVLRLVKPPERFDESIDFEQSMETLEPVLFILRRFLEKLTLRIESVYLLVGELRLILTLENGEQMARTLQIPAPTREVETLFRISSQYLETLQTSAPITEFQLQAIPSRPHDYQFDLFQGGLKDPNRFFQTLARLAALVGNDRVGVPQKIDTHRPDSVRLQMPELDWGEEKPQGGSAPRIGPGLRRYRPGIVADVEMNQGKPVAVRSPVMKGRILGIRGPWKLSGNWWDLSRWESQEWDIELETGGLYRLLRTPERWEVVGIYD
jgi:protein ImuB